MRILLGTTNPSKVRRFAALLQDYDVEFLTPRDLEITDAPAETGTTPVENAAQKAAFYGRFFDRVLCEDSGLYFRELPMDDPRQPGLHIRTPRGKRLGDEEMIAYYAALVHTLGGRCRCAYVDGYAACNHGKIQTFLHDKGDAEDFYMVDAVHPDRIPGWPLDSLSVEMDTGRYSAESNSEQADSIDAAARPAHARLTAFLAEALGLQKRDT